MRSARIIVFNMLHFILTLYCDCLRLMLFISYQFFVLHSRVTACSLLRLHDNKINRACSRKNKHSPHGTRSKNIYRFMAEIPERTHATCNHPVQRITQRGSGTHSQLRDDYTFTPCRARLLNHTPYIHGHTTHTVTPHDSRHTTPPNPLRRRRSTVSDRQPRKCLV